jgi:hypothetical protein
MSKFTDLRANLQSPRSRAELILAGSFLTACLGVSALAGVREVGHDSYCPTPAETGQSVSHEGKLDVAATALAGTECQAVAFAEQQAVLLVEPFLPEPQPFDPLKVEQSGQFARITK